MLARPRKKVLECHSALLRVRYYVRGSFSVRPLLPPSSIDCCVRKNGLECGMRHPEWQDGSELAVCRREGDAKAALQRSHERANLSHGIVSGFRIVSPLCLTQRDLGDGERRQAETERQRDRRLSHCAPPGWMDGRTDWLAVTAMPPPPTVRRPPPTGHSSVDFRINDVYLQHVGGVDERGEKEGRKQWRTSPSHKSSIGLWYLEWRFRPLLAAFSELELNGSSSDRCMQPRSRPLPFRFWHICTGPFFCEPLAAPGVPNAFRRRPLKVRCGNDLL